MKTIDLEDLPPRVAASLAGLDAGEELILVSGGRPVARLVNQAEAPAQPVADLEGGADMEEVMDQFNALIHDAF